MTGSFEDTLRTVLGRATEPIGPAGLAGAALREANRRRTRRRGAAAAGLASALVVSVVVATQLADDRAQLSPPPATSTPTPTSAAPTTSPSPTATNDMWDPRRVDELPPAAAGDVPFLPAVVDPPASATPLADAPIEAATVVAQSGRTARLLSTDGEWRSVQLTDEEYPYSRLSPEGTQLLVYHYADRPGDEVTVYDLPSGTSHRLAYPPDFKPWDFTSWTWADEQSLLLVGDGSWLVDATTGASERASFPSAYWTIASDGSVLETSEFTDPAELTDWRGGLARRVSEAATGRLLSLQADADTVVGTSYDERPFSVIVADRQTLTPQSVLPILDTDANYSNGGLSVLALMDDGSLLLRVAVFGTPGSSLRIVRWEPASGDLSLVTGIQIRVETFVDFASGLIRRTG